MNFKKPNTKSRVEIEIEGVVLKGIMIFDENGKAHIKLSKSQNNPQFFDKLILKLIDGEVLNETSDSITIKADEDNTFSFKVINKKISLKKAFLSILRAGYLLAYVKFGAEFLASNINLEVIREQLDNPDKEIIANFGIFSFSLDEKFLGVNWVPGMNCYLSEFKCNKVSVY